MRGFKSSDFSNLLLAALMLVVELTVYPYGLELAALKTSQNLKGKLNIIYVREELVRNLIAFFETRKTGTFLDRI